MLAWALLCLLSACQLTPALQGFAGLAQDSS